jgi:hypothetical protein
MALTEDDLRSLAGKIASSRGAVSDAARSEALGLVKRGQASEREAAGVRGAVKLYADALELDPSCKAAYEAVGKLVLGREAPTRDVAEAAVAFFDAAQKLLPSDATILDLGRRVQGLVSEGAALEPALARSGKSSGKSSGTRPPPVASNAPRRTCPYCNSPIPAGAASCRSCQLSGEVQRKGPAGEATGSWKGTLLTALALLVVLGGVVAAVIIVRHAK